RLGPAGRAAGAVAGRRAVIRRLRPRGAAAGRRLPRLRGSPRPARAPGRSRRARVARLSEPPLTAPAKREVPRVLYLGPFATMADRFAVAPLLIPIAASFHLSLAAVSGAASLFGHGNVAGVCEALFERPELLTYYQARNEQQP